MANSAYPSELAYFQEVTSGTGPANGAAWVSSGQQFRHIAESFDVSNIKQAVVEDARSQTSIFGLNQKVLGLKNVDGIPFQMYCTGTGATTAGGAQVTATPLGTILAHCLGGEARTNSTTVAAGSHSTTEFDVTSATNLDEGSYIAIAQASAPTRGYVRRVVGVDSVTITVDQVLPFTPAENDLIYGCEVSHITESVLKDSKAGNSTFSYLGEKGGAESWELNGCKTALKSIALSRGELPLLSFEIMAASFLDPLSAPSPSWTATPWGPAPVSLGADCECWLVDESSNANTLIDTNEVSIEVGVPVVRIPTVTEHQTNMEGTYGYSTQPADTLVTLNVPYDTAFFTDFNAATTKAFRWSKVAGPGQGFAICLPKAEVADMPARGTMEANSSLRLVLRGHPDAANASASDADLWISKIKIIRW